MDNNKFTRLTLEQQDRKIVWEISYDDVTGTDMIDALKTLMIGMTFAEDTIYIFSKLFNGICIG